MKFLIKCHVKNDLTFYKFKFKIYDLNNNLILSDVTNEYGCYTCKLPQKIYKIKIYSDALEPNIMFGILNKEVNNFCFIKSSYIIATLYDQNYLGLKIGKGKILLWPNHM